MTVQPSRVPWALRPFYRCDGAVNGGRVAIMGAVVLILVLLLSYAGVVIQRSGATDAGGYALLAILLGVKIPALGILLAIMTRQLRRALPDQPDSPEIEGLEVRLAAITAAGPEAVRLRQDAWDYAHRAPGLLGTRAAEVALACERLLAAGSARRRA